MVLWADSNIKLEEIWDEMARRTSESGLEEKTNRVKT
jgi:phosphoribosyl-ATP pyrophosphohydrolase